MVRIRQTAIIQAPVEAVWDILRDFNSHARWHAAIAASHIEGHDPATRVGIVRNFRLRDGAVLREQLLSLSDKTRSFSYCLLEAPFPLMNYVAEVRLKRLTDGDGTFWEWSCRFDPPAHRRDELVQMVTRDIYQAGFSAMQRLFSHGHPLETSRPVAVPPAPIHASPAAVSGTPIQQSMPGREKTNAIVIDRHGGAEEMHFRSVDLAPPAAGEVRIRHTAIGVNYIDIYCRTGFFGLLKPPGTPGMEAAGIVESVGRDVQGLAVGDRVAYACPPVGAYCERRNMRPDLLVRLPDDIADETAAAGLLKGVTASFLLEEIGRVSAGQTVLIHAAAGGVGQLLVQWARHLGATVIATTSSEEKARSVRALGADHVVNYSVQNFAEAVMDITRGHGADVIYDAVGRDTLAGSIAALAVRGHLISFGQASGPIGTWDIDRFAAKSITFSRPNYGHYTDTPEKFGPHVRAFFQRLRQGQIHLSPPMRFDLRDAAEAHRHVESRASTGSTILIPDPDR